MIQRLLLHHVMKSAVIALVVLVLVGVFPASAAVALVASFCGLRWFELAVALSRVVRPPGYWEARRHEWLTENLTLTEEERAEAAAHCMLPVSATAEELAEEQVREEMAGYVAPRPRREVGAEMLGVLAFVALLPVAVALYASDFVSLRMGHGWIAMLVIALGVAAYAWPHTWPVAPGRSQRRIVWWAVPFFPLLLLVGQGLAVRHPYLDPLQPERRRLAAERIVGMQDNIIAGRHADWVLDYARALEARGEAEKARSFYQEGIRLNPNDPDARARLEVLDDRTTAGAGAPPPGSPKTDPRAPLWTGSIPKAERRATDARLADVDRCTVVIQPVGEVADALLDAVAYAIAHELGLPAIVSTDRIALPVHTRQRGLLGGKQWDATAIIRALQTAGLQIPEAPLRHVLVTHADIYMGEANFVFSGSSEWGAVVSSARFGEPGEMRCLERTAKQSLGALLKSFGIAPALSPDCVTSYTRSLEEFDAKGNRPNAETLAAFQRNLAQINERWAQHQATRGARR